MMKRLTFYTALMLLIPLATWGLGWQWDFTQNKAYLVWDYLLILWTETASAPYALATCVVLVLGLMWLARKQHHWFFVGVLAVSTVVGTQVIKTGLKLAFQEPRPFVTQLEKAGQISSAQFYQLNEKVQAVHTIQSAPSEEYLPIVIHQAGELGYSFPSGHTIFAVSWLLLFAGLLQPRFSTRVTLALLTIWAAGVLISRLRLGMHFPIDLLVSTLLAYGFVYGLLRLVPRLSQNRWLNGSLFTRAKTAN